MATNIMTYIPCTSILQRQHQTNLKQYEYAHEWRFTTEKKWLLHHLFHFHIYFTVVYYARKQRMLSARLSHCNSVRLSVRLSVTRVDQSKTVQAKITISSPSAAWKTLVSGTAKLFHKFEGVHPERGR